MAIYCKSGKFNLAVLCFILSQLKVYLYERPFASDARLGMKLEEKKIYQLRNIFFFPSKMRCNAYTLPFFPLKHVYNIHCFCLQLDPGYFSCGKGKQINHRKGRNFPSAATHKPPNSSFHQHLKIA